MVVLVKLALAPNANLEHIGALFLALLAYNAKRHINTKAESNAKVVAKAEEILAASDEMKSIKSKLVGIESVMGMKNIR